MDTATQPPGAQQQPQQFLRLPVDSARKLRYYDRPELNELVTTHARDMATVQAANAALRQVRRHVVLRASPRGVTAFGLARSAERAMQARRSQLQRSVAPGASTIRAVMAGTHAMRGHRALCSGWQRHGTAQQTR